MKLQSRSKVEEDLKDPMGEATRLLAEVHELMKGQIKGCKPVLNVRLFDDTIHVEAAYFSGENNSLICKKVITERISNLLNGADLS